MGPDIMDLIDNLKQISMALSSVSKEKSGKDEKDPNFEDLHKEEFRLMVEKSSTKRKLDKHIKSLEADPTKIFVINRIKKTIAEFK